MQRLLKSPGNHAHVVVAITENVITGRQAMRGALLLHLVELFRVKLMIADDTPIVRCRVHGEAWRQRAVSSNDQ